MKSNCFIKEDSTGKKSVDEAIKSVKSLDEAYCLCNSIKPESLQKYQKERLAKKLIKYAKTYDELLRVKDYVENNLKYQLPNKQVLILIEKLVWAAHDNQQLLDTQKYAKSKRLLSRYMKFLYSKHMADAMNKEPIY